MWQKDVEEFLQGRFQLDCPRIELIPCVSGSKKTNLSGSGYVSLNEDGHFDLKVYIPEELSTDEVFEQLKWKPGKVIGDEAYYDMIAHDISGSSWQAERFIPDKSSGPNGSMIIGEITELHQIEDTNTDNERGFFQLHFNEVVKVPLNTIVKEHETVGESTRKLRTGIRLARFEACGIDFEIEENEGHTKFSAASDAVEFVDVTINRIFESFCFVTSRSESWSILVIGNSRGIKTRIRAVKSNKLKSRIPSPISYQRIHNTDSVWQLFACYLMHTLENEKDFFHPLSSLLYSVIESGKASFDVEALTLSVSIESLLKDELSNFYGIIPDLSSDIEVAKKLISESKALNDKFKKRVLGSFSAMKRARAKDILFALRDNCFIDNSLVKTYGDLRNKSAHGVKSSRADVQNYYNQISAALVLFFQLVFLIIKYEGEYTDYGTYGYPTKQFNRRLP